MDVLFFFRERTKFIRHFYEEACAAFVERQRKIEVGEEPFVPPNSEDDESPFFEEWQAAETSIEALGGTCVSMLSASLQVYFETWRRELSIRCGGFKAIFKKKGFLHGYRACFEHALKLRWEDCPADFDVIEQVVLARNAAEHPNRISTIGVDHTKWSRKKYPVPFFVSEFERNSLSLDPDAQWWLGVTVHVSRDMLLAAIAEVEKLADWLDREIAAHVRAPLKAPRE